MNEESDQRERRQRMATLTPAERDVLTAQLRSPGKKLDAAAGDRGTSANTVNSQWQSIYKKLGVHTRQEALMFVVQASNPGCVGRALASLELVMANVEERERD